MKKVAIVGCSAYMNSGYGCPGEWRCLKAASMADGKFTEPSQVVSFIQCECPGRTVVPNLGMAMKLSELEPDEIFLSTCLVNSKPGCPYFTAQDLANIIAQKTGIPVKLGTHEYH